MKKKKNSAAKRKSPARANALKLGNWIPLRGADAS